MPPQTTAISLRSAPPLECGKTKHGTRVHVPPPCRQASTPTYAKIHKRFLSYLIELTREGKKPSKDEASGGLGGAGVGGASRWKLINETKKATTHIFSS